MIFLFIFTMLVISVSSIIAFLFLILFFNKNRKTTQIPKYNTTKKNSVKIYPKEFRYAGTLFHKETTQVIQLYERERYRYKWDYYIIFYGKNGTKSMMDLESRDKEYEDGDIIYVPFLDNHFKLYKIDHNKYTYQYNPNDIFI
jgi:hypothetical protein